MRRIQSRYTALATGATSLLLLISADAAQSVNVIVEGDTVMRIEDLPVTDENTGMTTYYDVDFVFNDSFAVYGDPPTYDFPDDETIFVALAQVLDALNSVEPVPQRAGPEADDQFFIGNKLEDGLVVAVGGEEFIGLWDQCDTDCLAGVPPPRPQDFLQTWADFTPVDELPRPSVDFSADPETIQEGGSSTLSWSVDDADFCDGTQGDGSWPGPKDPIEGTQEVSPTVTTTYGLTCEGPGGFTDTEVTVTVPEPQALASLVAALMSLRLLGGRRRRA